MSKEQSKKPKEKPKKTKKIENKKKKHLKQRNQCAYLGEKNPGRWKRAGEQSYTNKSAKNSQKPQKKSKKIENKERKQLKKRNECAYLSEKKSRQMEESCRTVLHKQISKELSETTKKEQKNRK